MIRKTATHYRTLLGLILVLNAACGLTESNASRWDSDISIDVSYTALGTRQFLWADVTVTNTGDKMLEGEFEPRCHWRLRVYDNAEHQGTPFYRSEDVEACVEVLVPVAIAPGRSFQFPPAPVGIVRQILSGHPAGEYFFTATLTLAEPDLQTQEFPAGSVVLEPR